MQMFGEKMPAAIPSNTQIMEIQILRTVGKLITRNLSLKTAKILGIIFNLFTGRRTEIKEILILGLAN